jgi:hypothetical protein
MTTKLKSTKRRVKVQEIPKPTKTLTGKEKKKVKGGLSPYIEQDNLRKPNITDGTSNTK